MAEMTGAGETSPKPRSLAMALRTDVPPPAPEITPVTSMPACLKKPLSIATATAAPEGSALYWVTRTSSAAAGAALTSKSATSTREMLTLDIRVLLASLTLQLLCCHCFNQRRNVLH